MQDRTGGLEPEPGKRGEGRETETEREEEASEAGWRFETGRFQWFTFRFCRMDWKETIEVVLGEGGLS